MDIIKAPAHIINPVYRAQFWYIPPVHTSDKIEKSAIDNAEIQQRLEGNIMEVGEPECWNLKELCKRKKVKISDQINMQLDRFDFWLIQSAFSFIPAHNSQFTWARIVTLLESLSDESENPIAYDAFPKNIYKEKDKKKEINIGLNFKFKKIVEANAEYIQKIELATLEPVVSVAGIGKAKPTWDFSGHAAFCLQDICALYVIIKTPVNSMGIKLSFLSHAEIKTRLGGVFPTTSKPIDEDFYVLNFSRGI